MRKDERYIAASMEFIIEYGSEFQISCRGEKDRSYISRQCRDLGLLIEIKKVDPTITTLDVAFSPKYVLLHYIKCNKNNERIRPKNGKDLHVIFIVQASALNDN